MLRGDSGESAQIQCFCICTGVVSTLSTHNICNSGHFKLYPVLSFLATDTLTNSSLSCELDIHDLIGINVHSTVLRKTLCYVCHLTSCILQLHNYSHMFSQIKLCYSVILLFC